MPGREGSAAAVRFCVSVIAPANLVLIVNLRTPGQVWHVVSPLTRRHPAVSAAGRSLVLRLAEVHGRLLDAQGRPVRVVPVDPRITEAADAPGRR